MKQKNFHGLSRSVAYELSEDVPVNQSEEPTLGDVIATRFSRRKFAKGALATSVATALFGAGALSGGRSARATTSGTSFTEIEHGVDETHHVAEGYDADVLLRWGDPVTADAPAFDPMQQTAEAQAQQFGYNCDYIGFVPLEGSPDHGLLCVNHEYTVEELMFPDLANQKAEDGFPGMTQALVDIEMAAHGGSVVEVKRESGSKWQVVQGGKYNRRVHASTPMTIAGPAAGDERMKTPDDPTGTEVFGTFNNCAGGITPWGTYLMAEENFHGYFLGDSEKEGIPESLKRYGVPGNRYAWGKFHDRFDIEKSPNESHRHGWITEVDVMDPNAKPIKRTALGRMKHEGGESIVNADGRVVIYMGDDQRFDYLYRFVTEGTYDPANREANRDLLDKGTLSVAKFEADGSMEWLPLTHGQAPLTDDNGFKSQADVVIEARRASDLLGATPMDRPEDVQPNPKTNRVYVMLTNNNKRKPDQVDGPNPRAENDFGQIVELTPPDGDHTATKVAWDLLVQCGDPSQPEVGAKWNAATSKSGWFASPDNAAVDHNGGFWVATDQGSNWAKSGTADGLWSLETEGELRGTGKMFFRVPVGAELCGPLFTPDDKTLFLAVQHPASDGADKYEPFGKKSTFADPATRWPDFEDGMPPRPSVLAVTKQDGGVIGS